MFEEFIYNRRAAKVFDCRISELHMRSVFVPSKRVIYVCNPKVAGSSIIQSLLRIDDDAPPTALEDHNTPEARMKISSRRSPRAFWECLNDPSAFRFAFVRNPYARILSCYRDKIESGREPRFLTYIGISDGRTPSLLEFLQRVQKQAPESMNRHWMPQSRLIPASVDLSMLGRFENLEEDLFALAQKLGLDSKEVQRVDAHKTNTGNTYSLSAAETELVNRIYAEDFHRFSYDPTFPK